jgi:ethanolamine utilization protein EutN
VNLAKVIGTVWATRKDENMEGAKMQIIQPLDHHQKKAGSPLVAVDTIGAGQGEIVYYVTAREATIPYPTRIAPIDAAIVGIVDYVEVYDKYVH